MSSVDRTVGMSPRNSTNRWVSYIEKKRGEQTGWSTQVGACTTSQKVSSECQFDTRYPRSVPLVENKTWVFIIHVCRLAMTFVSVIRAVELVIRPYIQYG